METVCKNARPDDLISGIAHCLLSARQFQRDAVVFFQQGSLASACVLGTIALEHIGQAFWLLARWRELRDGGQVPWSELRKQMRRDHEGRLRDGLAYFLIEIPPSLIKDPGAMWDLFQRFKKRAPASFHSLRASAQYVEPSERRHEWVTPLAVSEKQVHDLLFNTANCYITALGMMKIESFRKRADQLGVQGTLLETRDLWPRPKGDAAP
jgi:AbiV family abortive infection protein